MFYKINYGSERDDAHFRKSPYYNAIVKFGKYICDVKAINPPEFIRYVIEKGASLPVDRWASDVVYETYVRDRTAKETPEAAAERTILLMEEWSVDTGHEMKDFFRLLAPALAVHWIRTGRISPWLLYATASGQALLGRFSTEQLDLVSAYIDPQMWTRRIKLHREEVDRLTDIFTEAGL